jgi:hypothetical protein
VKQAKQQSELHRPSVCGNCTRSVKIRSGKHRIACTAHLTIMSASHEAECEEFLPVVANDAVPLPDAVADKQPTEAP